MKALSLRALRIPGRWAIPAVILSFGFAAWAQAHGLAPPLTRPKASTTVSEAVAPAAQLRLVWSGNDVDGDGQGDFVNPTGMPVRTCDDYGCGEFGARRDAGERRHEGVD